MSTPDVPAKDESAPPPAVPESPVAVVEETSQATEVSVEITDIKASGLPAKVGFFSGVFYVRVKGGKVPQKTKTAKYTKGDEFVASWSDKVTLSGLNSSKVEIEVYARRFFFSYKIIKKTESKESLAVLIEHSETPVELELLEDGQAAGKLTFKINKSDLPPAAATAGGDESDVPDANLESPLPTTDSPTPIPESKPTQDP